MIVIVEDPKGWYYNGFNPSGSEVECSKAVFDEVKKSVKLKEKNGDSRIKISAKRTDT